MIFNWGQTTIFQKKWSDPGFISLNVAAVPTYKDRLHGGISVQLKFKLWDQFFNRGQTTIFREKWSGEKCSDPGFKKVV